MYNFNIPESKKIRVILNTDLKNEVDDQFEMVHAILTQSFNLRGIIPAHFGEGKSSTSQQDSYREGMLILEKLGMTGNVRIENGAPKAMPDEKTPMDSPGARLIIEEAMKDDKRPFVHSITGYPYGYSVGNPLKTGNMQHEHDHCMDWRQGLSSGRLGI